MKLAVIGGGSTYTPELVDGLARLDETVGVDELVLFDIDQDRLEVVGAFAERMLRHRDSTTRLTLSTDKVATVSDASAVLLQLRVGGQVARASDETFPLECGCVGQETTGAGGLAKAMRTLPVVLDVAETARAYAAPGAWIVDFTNPVGIVTRALLDAGHRAVGLCNVAIGFQRMFAGWLDVPPARVTLDHTGLNHLTWIRGVHVDGAEVLPRLLEEHGQELAERVELPRALFDEIGALPSYYLRYFYAHDEVVQELIREGTRAEEVMRIERDLLALYGDPTLVTKPALLDQRGGAYYSEAAVDLIAALLGASAAQSQQVANVRNDGTLPFLPDDAVIETRCTVTTTGATPLSVSPMDPLMSGLIAHVSAYEELALDAALRGGADRVRAALLAHPLIGQWDQATRLSDELIARNREFLPWT
ncbi:MAG: 6-phospho-beta-glucosidase [Actinomycetes bacterium]